MVFFIHCHFLFKVLLLCLSLRIEDLSFEDNEWNRGRLKMEFQVEKLEHFRHILFFEFNREAKAAETTRSICVMYEDIAIEEITARK